MSNASTRSFELDRPGASAPASGKYIILPILACAYVQIIAPLLLRMDLGPLVGGMWTEAQSAIIIAPRMEHRIFWPAISAISIILTLKNLYRLTLPPHIISLFSLALLAVVSVLWAFKPEFAFIRSVQQVMIITSIILPALLAGRTGDLMRGIFLCFACALIINLLFVINQSPMILENNRICYPGYFTFKGMLGACAAMALLLSLHEILYRGWRRLFAIFIMGIAFYLIIMSDSKGSLAIALIAPVLAVVTLFLGKTLRVSPAIVLLPIPICYAILSKIVGNLINRISWYAFGNYDLSGRTLIWDFANFEIDRRPLLGWGYQSFWLVGPDAPSIQDAPGWVKFMPNAHNGYLDTMIDMGYVGFFLLIIFIVTSLHAIGRVARTEPARGWLLLTLALYVILTNFLETGWMRGMDILWLLFLFVAAETGRYWRPVPRGSVAGGRHPGILGKRSSAGLAQFPERQR